MHCPRCRTRLSQVKTKQGILFHCPRCNGRAAGLALLRRVGSKEAVGRLWMAARNSTGTPPGVPCPICTKRMAEVPLAVRAGMPPMQLDVCPTCQFVWFDPREFEQFPAAPKPRKTNRDLPIEAREAIAMAELKRDQAKREQEASDSMPTEPWHALPGLLGLPVEENAPKLRSWPWLTWGLAVSLAATFALTVQHLQAAVDAYGLVPARLWRHDGLTLVTSFFLHGGIFHLIGNVYFLIVFGDNVEDDLGRWRYVLLLAVAAFFGDFLHVIANSDSMTPCIGASGGISGVIAYYALRFPQARLGLFFRWGLYLRWIRFPAYVGFIVWVFLQFLLAYEQKLGIGNVAAFAHLGGAVVGFAAWCLVQIASHEERQPV